MKLFPTIFKSLPGILSRRLMRTYHRIQMTSLLKQAPLLSNSPETVLFWVPGGGGSRLHVEGAVAVALGVPAMAVASIGHEVPIIRAFLNNGVLLDGLDSWDDKEFTTRLDRAINHINDTVRA